MELTFFILLIALALILVTLGFVTDAAVLSLVGFAFLFLLSFNLMNGTVEYRVGEVTNFTTVNGTLTTTAMGYSYAPFQDHTYGFYLAIAAVFGFVVAIAGLRSPAGMRR